MLHVDFVNAQMQLDTARCSLKMLFYSICRVFSVTTTSIAERVERMFVVDVVVTGRRSSKQVEAARTARAARIVQILRCAAHLWHLGHSSCAAQRG